MIKSRILKGTILFVEIVVFALIALIFLLMYGIKLNNISYNDINVSQLYIKYDKNLIVNAKNLIIEENKVDINTTIDYQDKHLLLDIQNMIYHNAKLELKGAMTLSSFDIKEIINNRKDNLILENISFIYDKNIKALEAKKLFLEFKNKKLYISFSEPQLDGIKLDKSNVILENLDKDIVLKIELFSKTLLNEPLQNILNYYDITIPIIQKSGKNNIYVQLYIPLKKLSDTNAFVQVESKNGSVDLEGTKFDYKDLDVEYKDKVTKIVSKNGTIDFKENIFQYKNLSSTIANNSLLTKGSLVDILNNSYDLHATTNLYSFQTKGLLDIKKFSYEHYINLKDKKISFLLEKTKEGVSIKSKDIGLYYNNKNTQHLLEIKDFAKVIEHLSFASNKKENNSSIVLSSKDDFKHIDIKLNDLYVNIDSKKLWKKNNKKEEKQLPFVKIISNDGNITYDENDIVYHQFYIENNEENFLFDTYIYDSLKNKYLIDLSYNSLNKIFEGYLVFLGFNYNDLVKTGTLVCDFSGKIDTNTTHIQSDYLKMDYKKEAEKHTIIFKDLKKVLDFIPQVKVYQEDKISNLKIETLNNFDESKVIVNNIEVDYNSSKYTSGDDSSTLNLPSLDIRAFDSFVHYDNFDINTSVLESQMAKENITIQLIPNDKKGLFRVQKLNDDITITAKELSASFLNTLLKKKRFKNGTFEGYLKGSKKNLKGEVYLEDTTVKDVAVVNNLITFVNTTPALYNPILALPTLFRLGETGFDFNGYYLKDGKMKLDIDVDKKLMKIPYFKTNGKMTDFKGKGWVDFTNKTMHFYTDIIFLKDFSKAVNHIPLVNYIILGKDGNFVTEVDINGTFEKQEYETHTVKNTSRGVVNVIKRVISIPFLPFMGDSNSSNERNTEDIKDLLNP